MPFQNHHGREVEKAQVFQFFAAGKTPPLASLPLTPLNCKRLAATKLSNFSASGIRCIVDGLAHRDEVCIFPTSEHLFKACMSPRHVRDFIVGGPIDELSEAGFAYVGVPAADRAKKVKHWGRTDAVGVLARMHGNNLEEQGEKRSVSGEQCYSMFKRILYAKYKQDHRAYEALKCTGDKLLLEFDRSAARTGNARWGGLIKDDRIVGANQMGALLMEVRDELLPTMGGEPLQFPRFADLVLGVPSVAQVPRELTRSPYARGVLLDYHGNRHGGPDGAEAVGVTFGVAPPPAASPAYSPTSPAYSPTSPSHEPASPRKRAFSDVSDASA